MQGFMGEVYASFVFISVLFGTVVDKRYASACFLFSQYHYRR